MNLSGLAFGQHKKACVIGQQTKVISSTAILSTSALKCTGIRIPRGTKVQVLNIERGGYAGPTFTLATIPYVVAVPTYDSRGNIVACGIDQQEAERGILASSECVVGSKQLECEL